MSAKTLERDPEVVRLLQLPRRRRLQISNELYDSVNPPPELTEDQKLDLERIFGSYETHPERWTDWEVGKARILERLSENRR